MKKTILGEETLVLKTPAVEAGVTLRGGHLWPARFRLGRRWISPLSAAPWHGEVLPPGSPDVIRVLRGDFFCLPFGGNATAYAGESHPVHGESANRRWTVRSSAPAEVHLSMETRVRSGRIDKRISLIGGHPAIYQEHVVSKMTGRMPAGYHAMLRFPRQGSARLSTSRFLFGRVLPAEFEDPAAGGYSCLKPGADFSSLKRVPRADGRLADLSVYPAREGFEDLVLLVSDPNLPFAWTAAAVPEEGWVWFSLKDPSVLRSTVFWMSNGGRHYAPWSGRHRGVIGLEEVTANFHLGQAESVRPNALVRSGVPTSLEFHPDQPVAVRTIMAVAAVPSGFGPVRDIVPARGGVEIVPARGRRVRVPLDTGFLRR